MVRKPGSGSNVVVVGCGRSGVAATRLLRAHGASVTVVDDAPRERLGTGPDTVEALGAAGLFGASPDAPFPDADWLVLSPGVPATSARFAQAVAAGATLVGEIALASWYCPAPMVVITGTNGKTTTATLVHHMLCAAGVRTVLAGNVGTAFSGVVAHVDAEQVVVLEVSSYQLEHASGFAPRVGAILNLTPDHLDRYASFDAYVAAKRGLWDMLAPDGLAVANADDARVVQEAQSYGGRMMWFGIASQAPPAYTVVGDRIVRRDATGDTAVMPVSDVPLLGAHNVSNVLAALACTSELTDRTADVADGIRTFRPVEHRLEPVREVGRVLYINDSKGTNVSATVKALEAMDRPTVLLLGGRGKGAGYTELRPMVTATVRHLVVYGEDAARILADVGDLVATTEADTFADAVHAAAQAAEPGDAVLLSPACASFDMFLNFEERGRTFKHLVEEL